MIDVLIAALIVWVGFVAFMLCFLGLIELIKWPIEYLSAKNRMRQGAKQAARLNAEARQRIADARARAYGPV